MKKNYLYLLIMTYLFHALHPASRNSTALFVITKVAEKVVWNAKIELAWHMKPKSNSKRLAFQIWKSAGLLFQQLKFLTAMELTTLLWMGRSSRGRESITERHFLALIFSSLKAKEVEIQASDFQKQIMFVHSTSLISKITIMFMTLIVLFYYRIVI